MKFFGVLGCRKGEKDFILRVESLSVLDLRTNTERGENEVCHPEQSEGSLPKLSLRMSQVEMLRSAQHDSFTLSA